MSSITRLLAVMMLLTAGVVIVAADEDGNNDGVTARLTGFQQVPPLLTNGTGDLKANLSTTTLTFTLTYSNLSGAAQAAHFHFAQAGVNGAIVANICGAGTKPACPAGTSATITGPSARTVPLRTSELAS
jgi:CHRD domain-containing protein